MKKLLVLLVSALSVTMASAETRVRLSAKTVASSRNTDQLWKTDYGSYDRDVYQIRFVAVAVQCTMGDEKGKVVVQWIGRNKAKNSKAELLSVDEKEIPLKPGSEFNEEFSEAFAESDAKYKALGERDRDGYRFGGWNVRVLAADGKVLAEQSSSPPLLKKFTVEAKPVEK